MSVPDSSVPDIPVTVFKTPDSNIPPVTQNLMLPTDLKSYREADKSVIDSTLSALIDRLKYKFAKLREMDSLPVHSMVDARSIVDASRRTRYDIEALARHLSMFASVLDAHNGLY